MKAALIYRATATIRAIKVLPGHTMVENTVGYLGVPVDDALLLAKRTKIQGVSGHSRLEWPL